MRSVLNTVVSRLQNAKSILVVTHRRPDGDGVGGMLAILHAFQEKKRVTPIVHIELPKSLAFLPGADQIQSHTDVKIEKYDLTLVLDCGTWERTGLEKEQAFVANEIIFIDHHLDEREKWLQGATYLIEPLKKAASTTMLLYDLFREAQIPITTTMATCLLAGLIADTGGFIHANTSPRVLHIAADLMNKGASFRLIAKNMLQNKSTPLLKLWGKAIATMKTCPTGLAYSVITYEDLQECKASLDDLSGVANIMSYAKNVKCAIILTQITKTRIKVSLRTEERHHVNVEKIAQKFGGGGHPLAAGFEMDGKIVQKGNKWHII